jgi:DNA-binding transcriptional LysR family regulator
MKAAISLSGETEARLTFVLSDTLHPDVLEELMVQFDRKFPHTEFECLIGEDEDVIDLLQKGRAQWVDRSAGGLPDRHGCYASADANLDGIIRCGIASAGGSRKTAVGAATHLARAASEYLSESGTNVARGPVWSLLTTCYC